jgi:hypothetical protein
MERASFAALTIASRSLASISCADLQEVAKKSTDGRTRRKNKNPAPAIKTAITPMTTRVERRGFTLGGIAVVKSASAFY